MYDSTLITSVRVRPPRFFFGTGDVRAAGLTRGAVVLTVNADRAEAPTGTGRS